MTVINEFDEYDHFVTVILVWVILVLNIGKSLIAWIPDRSIFKIKLCTLKTILCYFILTHDKTFWSQVV